MSPGVILPSISSSFDATPADADETAPFQQRSKTSRLSSALPLHACGCAFLYIQPPLFEQSWLRSAGSSTKQRLKVPMQRSFEFPHEQPSLSLIRLEKQPEDRFEELDSHSSAQSTLRLREVWGTDLKAEFKAGLQLFWQSISQTRKVHRRSRNGKQDMERGMSKVKREQGVNDLIQPGGERKRGSLD
jgi:hypothetical protein